MTKNKGKILIALTILLALLLLFPYAVKAVGDLTPAGTPIDNNATATYEDEDGNPQPGVDSGIVTVIVGQVYGVDIEADNYGIVSPGGNITFPHTITNTGNGDDSFTLSLINSTLPAPGSTAVIYIDENGNGILDSGETTQITSTGILSAGESLDVIVFIQVPLNSPTTNPPNNGDEYSIQINAQSDGITAGGSNGNFLDSSDLNTDELDIVNGPVLDLEKEVSPTIIEQGQVITYILRFSNTGNAPAYDITLTDTFSPVDIFDTAYGINGVSVDAANTTFGVTNVPQITPGSGNITFQMTGSVLGINQNAQLVFRVRLVDDTSSFEPLVRNYFNSVFDDDNDPLTVPDITSEQSNTVTTTIIQPGVDEYFSASQTVQPGATVQYGFTVENTGNVADSFNVSTANIGGLYPLTFVAFHDVNGNGRLDPGEPPLGNTDGNPNPNTALLNPGETFDVVLVAAVPSYPAALPDNAEDIVQVTVTGSLYPAATDDDVIFTTLILGPGVDIIADRVENGNPGETVTFFHTVINTGTAEEDIVIDLNSTQGWTYNVEIDTNGDGIGDIIVTPNLDGTFTLNNIPAGGSFNILVSTQIPPAAPAGTTDTLTVNATVTELNGIPVTNGPTDFNTDILTVVIGAVLDLNKIAAPTSILNPVGLWAGYPNPASIPNYANPPIPSEFIVYAIPFINNGSTDALNIVITDLIPANTTYVVGSAAVVPNPSALNPLAPAATFYFDNGSGTYPWGTGDIGAPNSYNENVTGIRVEIPGPVGNLEGGVLLFTVVIDDGQP